MRCPSLRSFLDIDIHSKLTVKECELLEITFFFFFGTASLFKVNFFLMSFAHFQVGQFPLSVEKVIVGVRKRHCF